LDLLPDPHAYFKLRVFSKNDALTPQLDDFEVQKALARLARLWKAISGQSKFSKVTTDSWYYEQGKDEHSINLTGGVQDRLSIANQPGVALSIGIFNVLAPSPYMFEATQLLLYMDINNTYDI
jgi:hypothetical protein